MLLVQTSNTDPHTYVYETSWDIYYMYNVTGIHKNPRPTSINKQLETTLQTQYSFTARFTLLLDIISREYIKYSDSQEELSIQVKSIKHNYTYFRIMYESRRKKCILDERIFSRKHCSNQPVHPHLFLLISFHLYNDYKPSGEDL